MRYDSATIRARALRLSFISLISRSTSSMNLNRTDELRRMVTRLDSGLDDEVDDLVLQHGLGMGVGDEERDIIALQRYDYGSSE